MLATIAVCAASPRATAATDAGEVYRKGAVSSWVDLTVPDFDAPIPKGQAGGSAYYLLFDRQIDVRERGNEWFTHVAIRLLNQAGVDEYSQFTLYVDPSFQKLTLHWVRIRRGAETLDRLANARVTVLPVESELQNRVYSGEQSISLLIPDLQVGDVFEYAYSTASVSPSFPEHFATELDYLWSNPVHSQRIRLRHRSSDSINYRVHGGDAKPDVREYSGYRELVFSWRDLEALPGESDIPAWYPMWSYVEFSDMDSWQEVAGRTAAIYRHESIDGPLTQQRVADLKAMHLSAEDLTLKALRMVQDDIQYASLSIGQGSFRPNRPDLVLERRFGDCKDKSLLLSTMLNDLGIDARPALVHTSRGRSLVDALPTPLAFDHAIVRVKLGDRVFWLDPTQTMQGGTLANVAQSDYQQALVIDAKTKALERLPPRPANARIREVATTFDLSAGVKAPATVEVVSHYRGESADDMRFDFASRDAKQRELDFLNYYAGYYPGIKSDGPIDVQDDRVSNVIVVRERYRLPSGFRVENSGGLSFELFPDELYHYSEVPNTSIRTAPLRLAYPITILQSFEVRLPEAWTVTLDTFAIDNPAFRYKSVSRYANRILTLEYRYEALADNVPIEVMPKYLDDIKHMSDDLGYKLTYDSMAQQLKSGIAPQPLILGLLCFSLGIWLAIRVTYRFDPAPRLVGLSDGAPAGISGWLLIPALNVLIMLWSLIAVIAAIGSYTLAFNWNSLPDMAPAHLATWARPLVVGLLGFGLLLLPSMVASAIAFFRARSSAPTLWIAMLWTLIVYCYVTYGYTAALGPDDESTGALKLEIARDVFASLLWTLYMVRSKRVKATFVRRLPIGSAIPRNPVDSDSGRGKPLNVPEFGKIS